MRLPVALSVLLLLPALASGSQVSGTVGDIKDKPLAGAALEVVRESDGKVVAKRQADAEGKYAFELPAGRYFLRVQEPSLCAGHEQVLGLTAPRELEIRGTALLQVLVLDPTGEPLPDALVKLVPEPLDGVNWYSETDARGLADLPAQPPGRYRLLAYWEEKDRFLRYAWRDLELEAGKSRLEIRFDALPSATLSGRVRGTDGLPVAGAKVTAMQSFPSIPLDGVFLRNTAYPRESATTQTDAEGRFTLQHLRGGEYQLIVEHRSGHSGSEVRTGAQPVEVSLGGDCTARISGRVVDERGAPVPHFWLEEAEVKDPEGRFNLQAPCLFLVRAKGFLPRQASGPGPGKEPVALPDLVLQRGRTLQGRVLLPAGKPLPKSNISAEWKGLMSSELSELTDEAGHFSLGPVPADQEVVLTVGTAQDASRFRVPAGQDEALTLRIPKARSRLEVRGLSADGRPLKGIHVTAHGDSGSYALEMKSSDRVLLNVVPGSYEVHVQGTPHAPQPPGVPLRFAPVKVQVSADAKASLTVRAAKGNGALRVLLRRWTHYGDILVLPGVHPWPAHLTELFWSRTNHLEPDDAADIWAQPGFGIYYDILKDFSELVPGTYTVFAKEAYGGGEGWTNLFRQVIQVDGTKRQAVPVCFACEDSRALPW